MVDDNKDIHIAVLTTLSEFLDEYDLEGWVKNGLIKQAIKTEASQIMHHKCVKCGKKEYLPYDFDQSEKDGTKLMTALNKWHKINAGNPGYGSILDMCKLQFELCDNCLAEFIQGFELRDELLG